MKKYFVFGAIAVLLINCQDDKSSSNPPDQQLSKYLGGKVDTEMALGWIDNASKAGQEQKITYSISQANLTKAIESGENIYGMVFHYGIDDQGEQHIILTPVGEDFTTWTGVVIDANTDAEISAETAQVWIRNYIDANDEITPRQHIYGINMFKEIQQYSAFEIVKGLNDDRIPQLLFVMNDGITTGRGKDEKPPVYDAGKVCPPSCP